MIGEISSTKKALPIMRVLIKELYINYMFYSLSKML